MPLPAVIGLAAFWSSFVAFVLKVVELVFTKYLRKIAIMTVVVGGVYIAIDTLLGLIASSLVPLLDSVPALQSTIGMALPSNTIACISAVIAVELACLAYSLTIKAFNYQAKVV
jgi:hypothetical protein